MERRCINAYRARVNVIGNHKLGKRFFLPNCLAIFLLVGLNLYNSTCFASQETIYNGEDKYLIKNQITDPKKCEFLIRINRSILKGEYDWALKQIDSNIDIERDPICKSILLMFKGTICYNKSDYTASLSFTRSSIQLISNISSEIYFRNRNNEAKIYLTLGYHKKADSLLYKLLPAEKKNKDYFNLAYSFHYLALVQHYLGNYELAETYFSNSISYAKKAGDLKILSSNLSFSGLNNCYLKKYSIGMVRLQESIRIRDKYGDLRGLANSYLNLNTLYDAMGAQDRILDAEYRSLVICRKIGDLQCISGRLIEIANLYLSNGKYEKAEFFYKLALKKINKANLKDKLGLIYLGLAKIEYERKEYQKSVFYCDSSVVIFENWDKKDNLIDLYYLKAKLYQANLSIDSAIVYSMKSLKLAEEFRRGKNAMLACSILSELYEKKGDFKIALQFYQNSSRYGSVVNSTEKSKWLMEKEIQFSLEKKQQAALQKQRQKELMAIQRSESQRKVSIGLTVGIILLGGLLIYSVYLYRQRNASQKSLISVTEQNAEMSRKMAEQEVFALIGEVSASVAHDLNTPLGAIKAGTENINAVLVTIVHELIGKCSEDQFRRSLDLASNRPVELFVGGLQLRKEAKLMQEYLETKGIILPEGKNTNEMAFQFAQARIGLSDVELIDEILKAPNAVDYLNLINQAQNLVSLLGTVTDSAQRAYEVVQNIREQIQATSQLELKEVNLKQNIEDVVKTFSHYFKEDYTLNLSIQNSIHIFGDSVKLYQLWSNLLKNAIEASPKNGTISVFTTTTEDKVFVHIVNQGEKIPQEVISKMFDRFYTTKKTKNGTGLGLAIVKKVVEIHDASIQVNSTEESTEFIISMKFVI